MSDRQSDLPHSGRLRPGGRLGEPRRLGPLVLRALEPRRWALTIRHSRRMPGWPFWAGVGLSLTPLIYYWYVRITVLL